jgi:hypothetical protein
MHLYGIAMALLGIGLRDSRYELALRYVIADRYFHSREPTCRS